MIIEIAGLAVSGLQLTGQAVGMYKDFSRWDEKEKLVNGKSFLDAALQKGYLEGRAEEYRWSRIDLVPEDEMSGHYQIVFAIVKEQKIKYKLIWGEGRDRLVLMKKI